jgi:hypothetical protein
LGGEWAIYWKRIITPAILLHRMHLFLFQIMEKDNTERRRFQAWVMLLIRLTVLLPKHTNKLALTGS